MYYPTIKLRIDKQELDTIKTALALLQCCKAQDAARTQAQHPELSRVLDHTARLAFDTLECIEKQLTV